MLKYAKIIAKWSVDYWVYHIKHDKVPLWQEWLALYWNSESNMQSCYFHHGKYKNIVQLEPSSHNQWANFICVWKFWLRESCPTLLLLVALIILEFGTLVFSPPHDDNLCVLIHHPKSECTGPSMNAYLCTLTRRIRSRTSPQSWRHQLTMEKVEPPIGAKSAPCLPLSSARTPWREVCFCRSLSLVQGAMLYFVGREFQNFDNRNHSSEHKAKFMSPARLQTKWHGSMSTYLCQSKK